MAQFACKCLNIQIRCENQTVLVQKPKLDISAIEQRDSFFHEEILSSSSDSSKIQITNPTLLASKNVGKWLVHVCLTCGTSIYASQMGSKTILINKSTKTTPEAINSLKNAKNYSPVFGILVPETVDSKLANTDKVEMAESFSFTQNAVSSLSNKLKSSLKEQLELIEESVRQFRDLKYAEFEAFKERMEREHKILSSLVSQTKNALLLENKDNLTQSPQLPQQRRRLSSIKDAKKLRQIIPKSTKKFNPDDDMSDFDDVFDLEGGNVNSNNSDADDSDSEANMTADERYAMSRSDGKWQNIARSLPMDMPRLPNNLQIHYAADEDCEIDPNNIAASIKALARSVHGDVFGDLPCPRVSTQI